MNKKLFLSSVLVVSLLVVGCGKNSENQGTTESLIPNSSDSVNSAEQAAALEKEKAQLKEDSAATEEMMTYINATLKDQMAASEGYGAGKHTRAQQKRFNRKNPEHFRTDGGCDLAKWTEYFFLDATVPTSSGKSDEEVAGTTGADAGEANESIEAVAPSRIVSFESSLRAYAKIHGISDDVITAQVLPLVNGLALDIQSIEVQCEKNKKRSASHYKAFGNKNLSISVAKKLIQLSDLLTPAAPAAANENLAPAETSGSTSNSDESEIEMEQ